ncbi:anthranilate phosphoribosyltransferase [Alphaproteobacteria bacterium]|nr:anthranilate phosphoribosyltransferase [Alphaproteobacteria bacterium]
MTQSIDMRQLLTKVGSGAILGPEEAKAAFQLIMSGEATSAQMGALLMGLRVRGETIEELKAGAIVMREKATVVDAPDMAIDTCGTGGDASGTYNISTAAAFIVAAAGVPVAKHGNRALSSKSGSADVLSALGVKIDLPVDLVRDCMWNIGIGFLMAPRHHPAMRHVASVRVELGTRTIFNLLGPLANPAETKYQLLGVYDKKWIEPMAAVLGQLGAKRAWVVHGSDGLDEITTTGPTFVADWSGSSVKTFQIKPEELGLRVADPSELKGGEAAYNADAILRLFDGEKGAFRDIVLLNAAAALVITNKVATLPEGLELAAKLIDEKAAKAKLQSLILASNQGHV